MMLLSLTRNPHIPLTLRKKIGRLAKPADGQTFRIGVFDQVYEGQTGNHMDNKIYLYGLHEAATIRLMRIILGQQRAAGLSPVLMDIGTNAGLHLIAAAGLADRAYGFEPWEKVRARAGRSAALNKLSHMAILPFGLSDEDATLPYAPPDTDNFGAGSFSENGTLSLEVRRGDTVVKELDITPTLLKIDVEGFERRVLTGLHDTLLNCRPAVIFEYSDMSRADFATVEKREALFGPGYNYYGIKRSREYPALTPFIPGKRYENVLAWPGGALPAGL